jgi:aarF domain-containing kinase
MPELPLALQSRIFIIVARFCAFASWEDDRKRLAKRLRVEGFSTDLITSWFEDWWQYQKYYK